MRLPKILALDDDKSWLSQIPLLFEEGYDVQCYPTIDQGIAALKNQFFDVILLDINFEGDHRTGLDLFRIIQSTDMGADVIVISGETEPSRIIQVMNAGVTQFLPKPVPPAEVIAAVETVIEKRESRSRAISLLSDKKNETMLIGSSAAMTKLKKEISLAVSSSVSDVLLLGETGTGKEIVARAIANKADSSRRFIPIHCGAISDGLAESELFGHVRGAFTGADRDRASAFEIAAGGYIFFDELGDMPLNQQAKLLRVLQERKVQRVGSIDERKVNFRSISATNVNLKSHIANKTFREDLYYRIAKMTIQLPALRERMEDIPELVQFFLAEVSPKNEVSITNDAIELLTNYHWPGNVRQLRAVVESICARNEEKVIRESDVCQAIPQLADLFGNRSAKAMVGRYGASLIARERDRFERAILEANGSRDKAAVNLGVSRATFYRRAKELGLVKSRMDSRINN